MQCTQCERVAHAGGLCRRCWNLSRGHSTSATSYTPRAGRVRYHGLSLLPGTVAALERAASTGRRTRAVIAAVLDAWAKGRVWRPPRVVAGGLVLALLVVASWSGLDCAARPPPERSRVRLVPTEALTGAAVLEQRSLPTAPEDWQKKPPCDAELDEHAINGACYARMSRKPPCGKLLQHGDACYRAVAKVQGPPVSVRER